MSQSFFSDINPATTSGTQLATILNAFKNAIASGQTGTSRPTNILAGGIWTDTTNSGSPNFYDSIKFFDGTNDIELLRVNLATGKASFSSSDALFEISKISTDDVGPILKMRKERASGVNNGQDVSGDVLGEFQFIGRTNDASPGSPIVCRIKAVAGESMTSSANGGYLVFEGTSNLSATLAEWGRWVDGKLGIGVTAPETALHVRSTTGMKNTRRADDATGSRLNLRKTRIAGTGATQNADAIGNVDFSSTDDNSAESLVAQIIATATQNHTSTAQGTKLELKTTTTGAAAATTKMTIGDTIAMTVGLLMVGYQLDQQNVATTATIAQLSAAKGIVRFTGSTATTVQGIDSAGVTKVILLHNASSAKITLAHQNGSATANDRFSLPSSRAVTIAAGSSIELFYDTVDTRWKLKSGAGSGSDPVSFGTIASPVTIAAATGFATAQNNMDNGVGTQTIIAKGPTAATEVAISANPQIEAGTVIGQEMDLIGGSDTDVIVISNGNGLLLDADSIPLYANTLVTLKWDGVQWRLKGRVG